MGCFDYVKCLDPEFVCAEGHHLSDEEFQTKDLGETMGTWTISNGELKGEDGGWGDSPELPFLGRIEVYCTCTKCPAFVQKGTGNLLGCSVDFTVEIVDNKVRKVERTFQQTEEWLRAQPWAEGCLGPFTYDEARQKHIAHIREFVLAENSKKDE